ncbi:hypothetical protein CBM2592_B40252 [Cupriavidus taiwanensis]|nr:hypothetical protein CBM2592_B40252 [Cupriavidus taiwanensis]SOY72114.1 hypothetical protein CBM2588_B40069 [Cupriavidus taiwanensis]SOY95678.1 hypothetical protein CBM2591_B20249 [Cupriavidus taiwanensis]SOZ74817.1 hypothetical protein CBM2617_B60164 [Cupriavidus taiwanensis]SOZ88424.1 hypothetical protein CBM2618_B50168 [Cupriavidus taiwanensis]
MRFACHPGNSSYLADEAIDVQAFGRALSK